MRQNSIVQRIMEHLDAAPTPYHAVERVKMKLSEAGFEALNEAEEWDLKAGEKYYVQRRDASILAFIYGRDELDKTGIRLVGAHTDSPVLKVKPNPDQNKLSYKQLGIEVYGGALLNPWFDRDLSIAGRVVVDGKDGVDIKLIDFKRPIAFIPSLAIHLDRSANQNRTVNPETDMMPVLMQVGPDNNEQEAVSFNALLATEISRQGFSCGESDIVDFDLSFYDTQGAARVGIEEQFIASARLDNLLSSFIGLESFLQSDGEQSAILALFDHEEVGSQSDVGARSNFLMAFLERLVSSTEKRHRMLHNSMILSVDNAHGIHPNYASKHESGHAPLLNKGPVIKYDANQSYATCIDTSSIIKSLAKSEGVPLQQYVTRADMRCGSTIGPMSAAQTGMRTIDLGIATFGMHSIRELAGCDDLCHLEGLLTAFFKMRSLSL